VQAGKLDASRQPKHPWVKLDGNNRAVIAHRYALDERRESSPQANREIHAKALLTIGGKTTRLAIGSCNLTRKGLGLVGNGNAEAGLLWSLPNDEASTLGKVMSFGNAWRKVTRTPEEFVVEPGGYDGDNEGGWPAFILSLRAKRDELLVEGDSGTWPGKVLIRMRDLRPRLLNKEQWFDAWTVLAPIGTDVFSASTPLKASWLERSHASARRLASSLAGGA